MFDLVRVIRRGCDHSLISQRIHLKLVRKHFVESQWFRFDDCLPQPELIYLGKKNQK